MVGEVVTEEEVVFHFGEGLLVVLYNIDFLYLCTLSVYSIIEKESPLPRFAIYDE